MAAEHGVQRCPIAPDCAGRDFIFQLAGEAWEGMAVKVGDINVE